MRYLVEVENNFQPLQPSVGAYAPQACPIAATSSHRRAQRIAARFNATAYRCTAIVRPVEDCRR